MREFDGLRGLLAVYVLLGHALPLSAVPGWAGWVFSHGQAAVALFFALSGMVISGSLERHGGKFTPFIAARAWRLLPVYILVLGLAVFAGHQGDPLPLLPWRQDSAWEIFAPALPAPLWLHMLAHLSLLHGAIPDRMLPYGWMSILGPAWSLSTEWQFYLLMGLVPLRCLNSLPLALLGLGFLYLALPLSGEFSRAFLPNQACWFALGIASRNWLKTSRPGLFLICLAGIGVQSLLTAPEAIVTALLWAGLVLLKQLGKGQILTAKPLLYLGAISYPLYLINEPVERLLALWLGKHEPENGVLFSLIFLPLSLLCSVAGAALLHRFVEQPFMQDNKNFLSSIIARPVRQ